MFSSVSKLRKMCEWLSRGEWCDVQLLCGGRAFSAHRAVLASVSAFLREVLLSSSVDETPIFIILPDFDLDALTSVLYYIYNGEVIIQKKKIEFFMDIIKALKIFIDRQCLSKLPNSADTINLSFSACNSKSLKNNNVFTLSSGCDVDEQYVNIKKGQRVQDILLQYSLSDLDLQDKRTCQNWSEQHKPSLGNLQSSYGDRQRNFFLRDSFIETYPRNGNVNGLTGGVPAILNERYRGPTSVLLTNANDEHPRADSAFSESSKKTIEYASRSFHPSSQFHTTQIQRKLPYDAYRTGAAEPSHLKLKQDLNFTEPNMKLLLDNYKISAINPMKDSLTSYFPLQPPTALQLPRGLREKILQAKNVTPSIDLSISHSITNPLMSAQVLNLNKSLLLSHCSLPNNYEINTSVKCTKEESIYKSTSNHVAKGVVFNQVLQSPWCPRLPNNYKPFRRKNKVLATHGSDLKEQEKGSINDNNNNIQTSPLLVLTEKVKGISIVDIKEPPNNSYSIASIVEADTFKCSICNQVFSSSESLATHARRHSSARYACSECGKTFSQLRNYKYHMSVHRGTREFAATCAVCGKYFNDRGYLSSHMKIHRNRKEYKCTVCPKSFNQRVAYNMHVRIHTGVKPHVCGECGKAFSRKMLLKQHQRTHSGERPYACPHCDRRFADRSNMTLHLRLHTGVKPFSCSLCPKSFTKKHHLKSHLNFHTGAKPYSCPRCKLAFTQSSNMRTHLKKCSAPEPTTINS